MEFYLVSPSGKQLTPYLQGFTSNIGKGGICLEANDLWWGFADRLKNGSEVVLNINSPFKQKSDIDYGYIAWEETVRKKSFVQYRLGIEFKSGALSARGLFLYALTKRAVPYLAGIFIIILSAFSFNAWFLGEHLKKENQKLLDSYRGLVYKSETLHASIEHEKGFEEYLKQRQKQIAERSKELQKGISFWKEKYSSSLREGKSAEGAPPVRSKDVVKRLKREMRMLEAENVHLKQKTSQVKDSSSLLARTLHSTDLSISKVNPMIIEGLYRWIKNRQDLRSGLVLSYEGDKDLRRVAFSYDEALTTIIFVVFGDNQRARKILDFYALKVKNKESIYNAYYTNRGVYEYAVSSGVNAWVGLAALYYTKVTGDNRYMPLARYISTFILDMMDKEGGIKGGPHVRWYSTEHNLDSYAFFHLFYEVSGEAKYLKEAREIEKWLNRYAYTGTSVPVNRGKGDATIATDTYAWSITALGPKILASLGMSAEDIIDFSVKNCKVKTMFDRQDGSVEVYGFDFAKARNIGRGGVISCEWTAQMILAFEVMADYYYGKNSSKARSYLDKARFYTHELEKMIINSPSPAGKADPTLPCASKANVDTGHGWRTPKGNRVGALSATAYFLLAYRGVNPLKAVKLKVSLKGSLQNAATLKN